MAEPSCRCEKTIPASVLDGFACGNPECWRTAAAQASFAAYVAELKRRRGETAEPSETSTPG